MAKEERRGDGVTVPGLSRMDSAAPTPLRTDVTVVGAGAAGLFCALVAAREVAVVDVDGR